MGNQPDNHRGQWSVGITDHITPPADIEQQAFPEADFRFLSDWRATKENQNMWRQVDAILVWHWPVAPSSVSVWPVPVSVPGSRA